MGHRVLLVDDEEAIRTSINLYLTDVGHRVYSASTVDEALEQFNEFFPDVVLVDLKMPGRDGFELIEEARRRHSSAAIIVISGHGDIEKAVRATKMGAHHFIEKPFSLADLEEAIGRSVESVKHLLRVDEEGVRMEGPDWCFLGVSDALKDVYRKILLVSQNPQATVLIQGESGTGKELVARAIFESTNHAGGRFVDVNCAALSETLLEAELFGHEKGSFTGAMQTRIGLFEAADGGVIFLDEIGEMPLRLQSKLLRVLEEKAFKRVGGVDNIKVNFRAITSTNRYLREMVEQGDFRADLFYRLNVFAIHVPPLMERRADIPALSSFFLKQCARAANKQFTGFTEEAARRLVEYDWPGNVRELRNVIERCVVLSKGGTVHTRDLAIDAPQNGTPLRSAPLEGGAQTLDSMEEQLIRRVLEDNKWQKARSAEILGINRTTLWHKIKRYGLEKPCAPG